MTLVPAANMAEIDTLSPRERELAVTNMLEQGAAWLAHARETSAPVREIAEFKAFVATVVEASRQKQLSKEIVADAEVMLRRSERAVGLATREGQARGEIAKPGDIGGNRADVGVPNICTVEAATGLTRAALAETVYPLTDGITDEQFEEAVTEARAEGNPSRANVVRKIKGTDRPKGDRHELLKRTHRVDPMRIITATVEDLAATPIALRELTAEDFDNLDPADAKWAAELLAPAMRAINHFVKEINRANRNGA